MQSKAKDVATYLKELPDEERAVLEGLRRQCKKALKSFEEGMDYGMPCYKRDGTVEVAWASQKNYFSLYILRTDVMKKHAAALKPLKPGKSCIKFTLSKPVAPALVEALLADTARTKGVVC